MTERTNEELADSVDDARRDLGSESVGPYLTRLRENLDEAARRLREMDRGAMPRTRMKDVRGGYTCENGHLWAPPTETCSECGLPRLHPQETKP